MTGVDRKQQLEKPLTARIPKALKQKFTKHCLKKEESVRERVLELVSKAVESNKLPVEAETMPMKDLGVLFVHAADRELKAQFKALCAVHDVSLERAVASLLAQDMASAR